MNVLIVDDEPSIRKMLAMWIEGSHHHVESVANPKDALALSAQTSFDLAFVDLRLGTQNGMDLIPELLKSSPWLKIVVITAHATVDSAVAAVKRGALDYLPKPFSPDQVDLILQRVAEQRAMERKLAALQSAVGGTGAAEIETQSPAMQQVLHRAQQVAKSDATVLIRGENGTGKGVLATLIHRWSSRGDEPFGVVSCPSLPPELLESELFGHVKGAFTGAIKDNRGRVAACEGGVLFLDEIGDLPPALQPKMLRFIQDHEYEAVGDAATRRANVRVITATNVDLDSAVKNGKFREDLYYRLNVVQLTIPPLRERRADVMPLAESFLAMYASQSHKMIRGFTDQAKLAMESHDWPGNVRELHNVVERGVIFCEQSQLDVEHLGLPATSSGVSPALGKLQSLEAMEIMHIRHVLSATRSLEEAADILGIDLATLWRKRRKHGL